MSWIKVKDKLPEMHYIGPVWYMSDSVFALIEGKYPTITRLNLNSPVSDKLEWLSDNGHGKITHWMPVELPNDTEM